MNPSTPSAAEILKRRYPSFHEPLRHARKWNRNKNPDELKAAADLLEKLTEKYSTVPVVWFEAAFNRVKRNDPNAALELLADIDRRFSGRLDEDTYCLWGRCYKDAGHAHLDEALALPLDNPARVAALEDADHDYANALLQYAKGFALDRNWFPGVNVGFLTFMRAALAAQLGRAAEHDRLLAAAEALAGELATATGWRKKQSDDDVWHEATRGEANALLGEWDEAVRHYRRASAGPNVTAHHRDAMSTQLVRILQAYALLGRAAPDLAAQLPELFPSSSPKVTP